jgi:hypothetical protein
MPEYKIEKTIISAATAQTFLGFCFFFSDTGCCSRCRSRSHQWEAGNPAG